MNDYQLGFTHACKLIKAELKKIETSQEVIRIIEFVEQEEIEAIKRGIGL